MATENRDEYKERFSFRSFLFGMMFGGLITYGISLYEENSPPSSKNNSQLEDSVKTSEAIEKPKLEYPVKTSEAIEKPKELTLLERYNLENRQLYQDFSKFCKENPNKREYAKSQYEIDFPHNKYAIDFKEDKSYFMISINGKDFHENEGNGLDDKFVDGQTFRDKNTNLIKTENLADLSSEKQLETAKEYTNLLKQIMHDEKYKNY